MVTKSLTNRYGIPFEVAEYKPGRFLIRCANHEAADANTPWPEPESILYATDLDAVYYDADEYELEYRVPEFHDDCCKCDECAEV